MVPRIEKVEAVAINFPWNLLLLGKEHRLVSMFGTKRCCAFFVFLFHILFLFILVCLKGKVCLKNFLYVEFFYVEKLFFVFIYIYIYCESSNLNFKFCKLSTLKIELNSLREFWNFISTFFWRVTLHNRWIFERRIFKNCHTFRFLLNFFFLFYRLNTLILNFLFQIIKFNILCIL